jgi:serine/threonine protein kinase
MDRSAAQANTTEIPLFRDGLGERFLLADNYGRPVRESLLVRAELAAVPAFEYALNLRITELEHFQHPSFVRIHAMTRTAGRLPRLSLVSDYVPGRRLSEILMPGTGGVPNAPPSMPAALFLIREILDAVAVLHRQAATTCHGALGPERIIIGDAQPRIAEYVIGSAIEQLRFSHDRYWNDLRIAVPPSAGQARFDRRTDVAQVGMLALALFAGRLLKDEEHLGNVLGLVDALTAQAEGARGALPQPLRSWLLKMLQLDLRRSYVSAVEAHQALEQAMVEAGVKPSGVELEVLTRHSRRTLVSPAAQSAASPSPALRQAQGVPSSSRDGSPTQDTERMPTASRFGTKAVAPRAASAARPPQQAVRPSRREYLDRLNRRGSWGRLFLQIFIIAGLTAGAFAVARIVPPPGTWFARSGAIVVDSKPQGAIILIDGERRGVTPATITIASGHHNIELRNGNRVRSLDVIVPSGGKIVETVELRPQRSPR